MRICRPVWAACYFCPHVLFPLFLPLNVTGVNFAALSNGNLPSGRPGRPHRAACYFCPYVLFPLFPPLNVTDVILAALGNGNLPSGRPGCPPRAACYSCPYVLFPLFLPLYVTGVIFAAPSNGKSPVFSLLGGSDCYIRHCVMIKKCLRHFSPLAPNHGGIRGFPFVLFSCIIVL